MNAKINANGEKCIASGNGCLCESGLCRNCSTQIGRQIILDVSGVTSSGIGGGPPVTQINGQHLLTYIGGCVWEGFGPQGFFGLVTFRFSIVLIPSPRFHLIIIAAQSLGGVVRGEYEASGLSSPGGKIDCVSELPKVLPFLQQFSVSVDFSAASVTVS